VDESSPPPIAQPAPDAHWLGVVVPKRHAKRSVTRALLKRQMRVALAEREAKLPAGLWVVRLKAPFDRKLFPSAASDALRQTARAELAQLLDRAAARLVP
jgi:ribonuclease P protein component